MGALRRIKQSFVFSDMDYKTKRHIRKNKKSKKQIRKMNLITGKTNAGKTTNQKLPETPKTDS